MKKILIATYLQRHIKKMIPVIKALSADPDLDVRTLLLTAEEWAIAEKEGIKYSKFDEYADKPRRTDFDLSWGLGPLISAIDRISPDLFIAIEVNYILRNAVRYCSQKKVPNLIIQHGTPNKYSLHAFIPFEGDCFAAWGQFSKDFLVSHGMPEERIVITGGIPFDSALSLVPDRAKIASTLGIAPAKKWVVFTTQGAGAGNRPSEQEIFDGVTEVAQRAIAYKGEYELIYQVHPGQDVDYIKDMVNTVNDHNAVVVKYKDTKELIASSSGVITFFSTTAIDAVIMEKPLLLITLTDDADFFPFVQMEAAFGAFEKAEIKDAFDALINQFDYIKPNMKKAADYVNLENNGKALERVIKLCYERMRKPMEESNE